MNQFHFSVENHMRRTFIKNRFRRLAIVCCMISVVGCGGGESSKPSAKVQGTVTYQGNPVEEGSVGFFDRKMGTGGNAPISADGTFETERPIVYGSYEVSIMPPVEEKEIPGSMPAKLPKPMANIPQKYRDGRTSGFKAEINATNTNFDFEMK